MATEAKPLVAAISVVYFYVRDMDAATRFFRDLLGIPLQSYDESWSEATLGGTRFALHRWREGAPEPGSGSVNVSFLVEDIDAAAARLREAGVEVGPIAREEYGSHCDVVAPEGYVVSLYRPAQ